MRRRWALSILLAIVVPLAAASALVSFADLVPVAIELPWYVTLALLLSPGLVEIEIAPVTRWSKAGLTSLYVSLGAVSLFFYLLTYVCVVEGACL
jgi:hypothetical protein